MVDVGMTQPVGQGGQGADLVIVGVLGQQSVLENIRRQHIVPLCLDLQDAEGWQGF